ncbi:MAG: hypothetical protein JSS66_06000 [Armatimonadetes bacterium]|nr:hypothetical protein [Armatimonadota bacterium]
MSTITRKVFDVEVSWNAPYVGRVSVEAEDAAEAREIAEDLARDGLVDLKLETDMSELLGGSDFDTSIEGEFEVGDTVELVRPIKSTLFGSIPQGSRGTVTELEVHVGSGVWLQVAFEGEKGSTRVGLSAVKKIK